MSDDLNQTVRDLAKKRRVMNDEVKKMARDLEKTMRCNCDLDNWQPEASTGHSWVCRVHKAANLRVKGNGWMERPVGS